MTLSISKVPLPIIFCFLGTVVPDHDAMAFSKSTTHLSMINCSSTLVGISYLSEWQRRVENTFLLHNCFIILFILKIYAVHLVSMILHLLVASSLKKTSDQRLKFYQLTNHLRTILNHTVLKIWLPILIFCLILATLDNHQTAFRLLSLVAFFENVGSRLIHA